MRTPRDALTALERVVPWDVRDRGSCGVGVADLGLCTEVRARYNREHDRGQLLHRGYEPVPGAAEEVRDDHNGTAAMEPMTPDAIQK